jgi:hypothetical protein
MSASPTAAAPASGFARALGRAAPLLLLAVFLILMLAPLVGGGAGDVEVLPTIGYLMLGFVTWGVVAGVRSEPGSWLRRRAVRRVLVAAIAADCAAVIATSTPGLDLVATTVLLLFFLVLLNIALGRATERVASAPDGTVDERQEALRNRAHRLAYPVFAVIVAAVLLADVVSAPSREWAEHVLGSGGFFVFLELLFVLPGMVLAVIEPAAPADVDPPAGGRATNVRLRVALALVAAVVVLPFLASVGAGLLPLRVISTASAPIGSPAQMVGVPSPAGTPGRPSVPITCRSFDVQLVDGWGVAAGFEYSGQACWAGGMVTELVDEACGLTGQSVMAGTGATCTATSSGGTVTVSSRVTLTPALLPFLTRRLTVLVSIDGNGRVEVST